MNTEVLWFVDRFGIRGQYYPVWLRLLTLNDLKPVRVKTVNLHTMLRGQLLTTIGSRKAPTWIPGRTGEIRQKISALIKEAGPGLKAIVLSSPESLAATGLSPEYATLGKLRGSVYEIDGVPAVVMLPMTAWFTQVSQKDIQLANYGAGSAAMMERMQNAIESRRSGTRGAETGGREAEEYDSTRGGTSDHVESFPGRGDDGADSGDDDVGSYDADNTGATGGKPVRSRWDSLPSGSVDNGIVGISDSVDAHDQRLEEEALNDLDGADDDSFFYIPVMTPVGKFMITADTGKLARIVNGRAGEFFSPPRLR